MAEALFDILEPGETRTKAACPPGTTRAVGIDLGTTNSLVAVVQPADAATGQPAAPVCLADDDGGTLVPSVVHYAADGSVVVGQQARALAARFPQDTIASAKRFMGRGPRDAEATRKLTPYRFAPGAGGRAGGALRGRPAGR